MPVHPLDATKTFANASEPAGFPLLFPPRTKSSEALMAGASVEEKVTLASKVSAIEANAALDFHKEDAASAGPHGMKLDKHGLPLIPQPSPDPSDPLNFPQWLKIAILLQVSFLAGVGFLNWAVINPAYVPLAMHFHITTVAAGYQTAIATAFAGIGSFLWVPLGNTFGRRPLLLFTTLLSAVTSLAPGEARTWSQLLGARALNGITTSSFITIGAGMVTDCFFLHERGRAFGVFNVLLSNLTHIAPIAGGFIAQYVNYRWCFYLAGIVDLTLFVIILFCLPETLYMRGSRPVETSKPILRRMRLWGHRPEGKHLQLSDFWRPFQMVIYPSVTIPAVYYSITFSFATVLPAVTSATLFRLKHHFTTSQTGLVLGLGMLVGTTLGELLGGIVIDRSMYLSRKSHGGEVVPEVRLHGIWAGAILHPIGLLIWGFSWQYKTHWMAPTTGFAIMNFAAQIISTVIYSYTADCYKPQTPDSAQVFNFVRQTFGMTLGFWVIPMGTKIGYQFMGVTLALVEVVTFVPIIFLMYRGKSIREKMGAPTFNSRL
ncbi:MFS general substrate transporter [Mycena venus]|uniref:MFS general substrate transporter n=1 Tax=Mycena venus TaxID=2733690 RepID=A0A8H6X414_9AGAR|nr:MFS general substrate transporter [Mycena venus]